MGMVTFNNVCIGLAPSILDASTTSFRHPLQGGNIDYHQVTAILPYKDDQQCKECKCFTAEPVCLQNSYVNGFSYLQKYSGENKLPYISNYQPPISCGRKNTVLNAFLSLKYMFHGQCQPKTKSIHKKNTAKDKQQGKLKGFEKGFILKQIYVIR